MALRLIHTANPITVKGKVHTAKVYRDSEWQEYRVKFFRDGKHLSRADAHTDDKEDALNTARYGQTWAYRQQYQAKARKLAFKALSAVAQVQALESVIGAMAADLAFSLTVTKQVEISGQQITQQEYWATRWVC